MIIIDDEAFDDLPEIQELYQFFNYAGSWQFDLFSHAYVWGNKQHSLTEAKICRIIRHISTQNPSFTDKYYEIIVNIVETPDEDLIHVLVEEELSTIKKTAIVFLGNSASFEGGELSVDFEGSCLNIPYENNRLVLMTKELPYEVQPVTRLANGESRVCLIINFLEKKPNEE